MNVNYVRLLFLISGVYDLVIGLGFLGFGPTIFEKADVPPPNHWAYVFFASMLVVTYGIMLLAVAADPQGNRNFIPFGILLKLSYTGLVTYYWISDGVPMMFKPFAFIDGIMLAMFVAAYVELRKRTT